MNLKLFAALALVTGAQLLAVEYTTAPRCPTGTYWINEFTRGERVVADAIRHSRVVRWKADDKDKRQQWAISEMGRYGYMITNIVTSQPIIMSIAGQYFTAMEAILRGVASEEYYAQRYTMFKLIAVPGKADTFYLQEPTKNEYFSVGSDGGMVRWKATGENSQYFKLTCVY